MSSEATSQLWPCQNVCGKQSHRRIRYWTDKLARPANLNHSASGDHYALVCLQCSWKDTSIRAIMLRHVSRLKPSVFIWLSVGTDWELYLNLSPSSSCRVLCLYLILSSLTFFQHPLHDNFELTGTDLHVLGEERSNVSMYFLLLFSSFSTLVPHISWSSGGNKEFVRWWLGQGVDRCYQGLGLAPYYAPHQRSVCKWPWRFCPPQSPPRFVQAGGRIDGEKDTVNNCFNMTQVT